MGKGSAASPEASAAAKSASFPGAWRRRAAGLTPTRAAIWARVVAS